MTLNISKFGQHFMFRFFSTSKLYTKNHEWIKITHCYGDIRAVMGITDYSQKALGDIIFIEMPKVDAKYNYEGKNYAYLCNLLYFIDPLAVVESVKGASDVHCPVTGTVTKINSAVLQMPSLLNKSPENDGWICEIKTLESEFKKSHLLNLHDYLNFCKNGK